MRRYFSRPAIVAGLFASLLMFAFVLTPLSTYAAVQSSHRVRVPVLMYHYVRTVTNRLDRAGFDLSVTPLHFAQQMQLLHEKGFHTVTLDDLLGAINGVTKLPPNPILITFDDGYEDFYTTAFPILNLYGFSATSFVITGKAGQPNYMSWDQMRALEATGLVQFESHTVDHADMGHMSAVRAQYEMAASKFALQQELGAPVRYICYPSGHYNAAVISLLGKNGYLAGVGTAYGTWHSAADLAALTRVRIHGADTLASFAAKLGVSSK